MLEKLNNRSCLAILRLGQSYGEARLEAACREGYTAHYVLLIQLLRELTIANGDGQYPRLLANLAKVDVLIL